MSITEKQLRELIPRLSTKEAADILGVSRRHVGDLCRKWWIDLKPMRKIPDADAHLILELRRCAFTLEEIAEKWEVSPPTVSKYIKRQLEINPL